MKDALEGQRGVVVVDDRLQVSRANAAFLEAVVDGLVRKAAVVLDPREALLLGGGDDLAVTNETRGGVVIEARQPQDVRRALLPAWPVGHRCHGPVRRRRRALG